MDWPTVATPNNAQRKKGIRMKFEGRCLTNINYSNRVVA